MIQLAVQCKRCTDKYTVPPYIAFTLPVQTKPTYCPSCGRQRTTRPHDYADCICIDNAGVSRDFALRVLTLVRERNERQSTSKHTAEGLMSELGAASLPTLRTAFCPLNVVCNDCGGTFTMLRATPDTHRTPPVYCTWCGSTKVTTGQQDNEEAAFTALALHYNLPPDLMRALYRHWSTASKQPTFASYMASDIVRNTLTEMLPAVAVSS